VCDNFFEIQMLDSFTVNIYGTNLGFTSVGELLFLAWIVREATCLNVRQYILALLQNIRYKECNK